MIFIFIYAVTLLDYKRLSTWNHIRDNKKPLRKTPRTQTLYFCRMASYPRSPQKLKSCEAIRLHKLDCKELKNKRVRMSSLHEAGRQPHAR